MGANHLGHFLLTLSLVPALNRGAAAKPGFGARVVKWVPVFLLSIMTFGTQLFAQQLRLLVSLRHDVCLLYNDFYP